MPERSDEVWKSASLAAAFLKGVRGAIPMALEQIDVMLRLMAACGRPIRRFLDLGCGDGVLSAAVLERYPEAHAVLADFSAPMIDAAKQRFAAGPALITPIILDYASPSWVAQMAEWRPFDAVISGFSIHHQPDERKREIYEEIFQLLGPGGVFVNVEHVASASDWGESIHDDLFLEHLYHHHQGTSQEEVAKIYYHRPDKAANILAPVEAQCQWLREIGFSDVDCYWGFRGKMNAIPG
jgi:tRNA (cmo5U34)-methyltransferase